MTNYVPIGQQLALACSEHLHVHVAPSACQGKLLTGLNPAKYILIWKGTKCINGIAMTNANQKCVR